MGLMRKFIGDWFGHNRAALSVAVVLLGTFLPVLPNDAQTGRTALVLQLEGIVGPALSDYILRGLRTAADRKASLVILQMDTPGGLDTSMRDIIRGILGSPVPVATYVSPSGARAASAGTYILYASPRSCDDGFRSVRDIFRRSGHWRRHRFHIRRHDIDRYRHSSFSHFLAADRRRRPDQSGAFLDHHPPGVKWSFVAAAQVAVLIKGRPDIDPNLA